MERKLRRYSVRARGVWALLAERREAWRAYDMADAERVALRHRLADAEDRANAYRAQYRALQAALGIELDVLDIAVTHQALASFRGDWRDVVRIELQRRFADTMRQCFATAVLPLIDSSRTIGELDRKLKDIGGRITIHTGRAIVRAEELEP